jgi:predicted TIM-barrel fold metal-dependent hydrolase
MHVHLSKSLPLESWSIKQWPGTQEFKHTAEQYIKKMNNSNPRIDKALIFSFRTLHSESLQTMREENDYILESVEKFPNRFIGACLIDPSWGDKAIKELNRVVKKGLRVVKIKFSSVHVPANSPLSHKIFTEVRDLDILPVLHSDWSHWTNPSIIGDLLYSYPDMKVVLQHFGLSQSREALNVAKNHKGVFVDTSAIIHPKNILRFTREVSAERIMFASDTIRGYEKTMPQEEIDRVLNLGLPDDLLKKIFGENAEKLLRSMEITL